MVSTCATTHKINKEEAWDLILTEAPAKNEEQKCFIKCVGEGLGFLKEDGNLNLDSLAKPKPYLDTAKVPAAIEKCGKLRGTTVCDTAYKQGDCLFEMAGKDISEPNPAT